MKEKTFWALAPRGLPKSGCVKAPHQTIALIFTGCNVHVFNLYLN